jgi:Spy/CpxP family protein refolding chaperone
MKTKPLMIGVLFAAAVVMSYGANAYAGGKGKGTGFGGPGAGCPECAGKGAGECDCGWGMGLGPKLKGMGEAFMMKIARFVDDLDLSANQKTKIKELRAAFKEKVAPLMEKNQALRQEIIAELKKLKYDRKKVAARHEEMNTVKSEMMDLHFNLVLDIYDTLTDKQKDTLWKKVDAAKAKMAEKAGKGAGQGPGKIK